MKITLPRFRDWNPSSWDSKANYCGSHDRDHWFVAPILKSRDADILTESNWEYIVKQLKADKTPGIEIHSFNHWACGYYDIILIHPWRKDLLTQAEEIKKDLESYPVLDEQDYSDREFHQIQEDWSSYGRDGFIELLEEKTEKNFSDPEPDYSAIDELWWTLAQNASYLEEFDGNSTSFQYYQVINQIYTKQNVYIDGKYYKDLYISDQIIDRIMYPEKYRENPNQLKLIED